MHEYRTAIGMLKEKSNASSLQMKCLFCTLKCLTWCVTGKFSMDIFAAESNWCLTNGRSLMSDC